MITFELGQLVKSKAGRDKDNLFVVIDIQEEFLFLVDGETRRIEAPKKKKKKHVQVTHMMCEPIIEKLAKGERVTNADVRNSLKDFRQNLD